MGFSVGKYKETQSMVYEYFPFIYYNNSAVEQGYVGGIYAA